MEDLVLGSDTNIEYGDVTFFIECPDGSRVFSAQFCDGIVTFPWTIIYLENHHMTLYSDKYCSLSYAWFTRETRKLVTSRCAFIFPSFHRVKRGE